MTPIITKPLSHEEASILFDANAVFLGKADAIEAHRIVELFGEPAARFIDKNTNYGGYIEPGHDYNSSGDYTPDNPCLNYYYFTGFLKVVSNHNHRLQVIAHKQSEGGAIWDKVWEERCERLDAEDAKNMEKTKSKRRNRAKKDTNCTTTA